MTRYTPTPQESIAPGDYELDVHYKETAWFKAHPQSNGARVTQVHVSRPDASGSRTAYAMDVFDGRHESETAEIATGESRELVHQRAIAWMARNPAGVLPPEDNCEVIIR